MNPQATPNPQTVWRERWHALRVGAVRSFHAYATWLVGISWRRFIVLSLLLVIVMAIVHDMPPFTWTVTHEVADNRPVVIRVPEAPKPPAARPRRPLAKPRRPSARPPRRARRPRPWCASSAASRAPAPAPCATASATR
jgi:hypothetical protein